MIASGQRHHHCRLALVALLATVAVAAALQQPAEQAQPQQQQTDSALRPESPMGPSYEQAAAPLDKGGILPVVDVDRQPNKSTVDVHVPIFFDMTNHKDAESGRHRLDLSVLHGLVTVNRDRAPNANGQMAGPMKVTVFGIPVYQGRGAPSAPLAVGAAAGTPAGALNELDNSIAQTRAQLGQRAQEARGQAVAAAGETSEKLMGGLADFLGRIQTMVRQASQAIGSSQAGNYQQPAKEMRQQQLQPQAYERQPAAAAAGLETNQIERSPVRSARDEPPVKPQ